MPAHHQPTRRSVLRLLGVAAGATAGVAVSPLTGAPAWATTSGATSGTTSGAAAGVEPDHDGIVRLPISFGNADFPEIVGGVYQGPNLVEASGAVASRRYPGVLWIIRDGYQFDQPEPVRSRYRNALYAVRFNPLSGRLLRWPTGVPSVYGGGYLRYVPMHDADGTVPRMVSEDIALAPASDGGPDMLWCGDIGNNNFGAHAGRLWRCAEPNPYLDAEVTLDGLLTYWTNPDHTGPQGNCESLLALDGSLYLIVKNVAAGGPLTVGQVLRLPARVGGGAVDAVPVARLRPPAGVNWQPTAADLVDGSLLVSTARHWIRYEADPTLTGDDLIRALAAETPTAYGFWNHDETTGANEGIAWLRTGPEGGFMGVSEPGILRWWPGGRTAAHRS
ncbi:hypothetical protein [Actinopolymorpha pittospori]